MKHFTFLGVAAVGIFAAVFYWTNRQTDLVVTPPAEMPIAMAKVDAGPNPRSNAVANTEVIEPILVLPEWEIAPAPVLMPDLRAYMSGEGDFGGAMSIPQSPSRVSPRPETGRAARLWMPYAAEDRELSETRRLEWAKLAVHEAAAADFEETAEPPLLEKPER